MGHLAYCSLFNAVNSIFLIFYNLPIINKIQLFYNTFFRKDLNGKYFFHVITNYIAFTFNFVRRFFWCIVLKLIYWLKKSPTFDSYNLNKDIRIYKFHPFVSNKKVGSIPWTRTACRDGHSLLSNLFYHYTREVQSRIRYFSLCTNIFIKFDEFNEQNIFLWYS